MMRGCLACAGITLMAGCMVDRFVPTTYVCSASQTCSGGTCVSSDLEFNIRTTNNPTNITVDLADRSIAMTFLETTSATMSEKSVTLMTYRSPDTAVRLTHAFDGGPTTRARLTFSEPHLARDISATCLVVGGSAG